MIESVKYWINEFHIDGFRFDLMGVHDIETMNQIRAAVDAIDPTIYIYGEGWSAGTCAYPQEKLAMKASTYKLNGIGAFSDDMRDALRGPFSDDTKGAFLAGIKGEEESLKFGIVGGIAHKQVDMTHTPRPAGTDCRVHIAGRALHAGRRGNAARQEGSTQQFRFARQHQRVQLGQSEAVSAGV